MSPGSIHKPVVLDYDIALLAVFHLPELRRLRLAVGVRDTVGRLISLRETTTA